MMHFHPLRVREVRRETEDAVSVCFDVPADLTDAFSFTAGQYLTVRTFLEGEEVRRNYSICAAPSEGALRIAIKAVPGGRFSTWANTALKAGDTLEVMPPVGKFSKVPDPARSRHYVAFAAGSGITPVLSILRTLLEGEPQSRCTLVYGNRHKGSILFKDALEGLKDRYLSRFRLIHVLSRERTDSLVNSGRIDAAKCSYLFQHLLPDGPEAEFFICGPEEMTFTVQAFLAARGVPKDRVHFELFTIPGQKASVKQESSAVSEAPAGPVSDVSVKLDGIRFSFPLAADGLSILDAALKAGADLPYACKGGVCCTCKAKLKEGQVKMDVNWGLEPDEIEQGYILTCQSHPGSPVVVVDFDS